MQVYLKGQNAIVRILHDEPGIKQAVKEQAMEITFKAKRNLAEHRDSGNSFIEMTTGAIDSYISLVDPGGSADSIEFRHRSTWSGEEIGPLHILSRAAGLI